MLNLLVIPALLVDSSTNKVYKQRVGTQHGAVILGVILCTNPDTNLVEVVEIPTLRWFVGTQYHPEYNSTVLRPNPLFVDFIRAAIGK